MTPTKILNDLYVGDMDDGAAWSGPKICVLKAACPHGCLHDNYVFSAAPEPGAEHGILFASMKRLRRVLTHYQELRRQGPVLIHCGHGIERSPLAAVFILVETAGMSVSHAYEMVMLPRPQVQDRSSWLPVKYIWEHSQNSASGTNDRVLTTERENELAERAMREGD
jgi:hypothetical protein